MKTYMTAVLSVAALLAGPAYAAEMESVDCFYESNRTQAVCAIETSPSAQTRAGAVQPLLVAYASVARTEEAVDCFYEINKSNPACR